MENLANISELQVPPNEKNINKFNFPSVLETWQIVQNLSSAK